MGRNDGEASVALRALADDEPSLAAQPAPSLILLALALRANVDDVDRAARVLTLAARRYPGDFWVRMNLADVWAGLKADGNPRELYPRPEEAVCQFTAAVSIRPGSSLAHMRLGLALEARGKPEETLAEYREAVRLNPDSYLAHINLGIYLGRREKLDEALAEQREAVRLEPDHASVHTLLGVALARLGKLDEALAEQREAIRLGPDSAAAHSNLGNALLLKGDADAAIDEYSVAIRLQPDLAEAHDNLGCVFLHQGRLEEAIEKHREAIRLKPDSAKAHFNLGSAFSKQGKMHEAIDEYREAIRFEPDYAKAHIRLGVALQGQGKLDEALKHYREAIRLEPDHAKAHLALGQFFMLQGQYDQAVVELRHCHELGSKLPDWRLPSAQWVANAERSAALAKRIPLILRGEDCANDNADRLALALVSYETKRFAASARFWSEALDADASLANDRRSAHRYNAACVAALAGCGRGEDDPPPDDAAQTKLRDQAHRWLTAELAELVKLLGTDKPHVRGRLQHWLADADLAGIRDRETLERLPEPERAQWKTLWADVNELLKRTE
jgi:tetratricopeptide (TPR) repeat protein